MALRPRTPDRQGAGADGGFAALNFTSSSLRSAFASFRPQAAFGGRGASPIYASHFRDAIYLNQAEAETLFRVCSANFNLTLFQFFSTNLRENSAGSSALINRK